MEIDHAAPAAEQPETPKRKSQALGPQMSTDRVLLLASLLGVSEPRFALLYKLAPKGVTREHVDAVRSFNRDQDLTKLKLSLRTKNNANALLTVARVNHFLARVGNQKQAAAAPTSEQVAGEVAMVQGQED